MHLSPPDSDWEGAHLVYVPYCSSDAHMGDSEHEVGIRGEVNNAWLFQIPGYGVQQFRGRRLARLNNNSGSYCVRQEAKVVLQEGGGAAGGGEGGPGRPLWRHQRWGQGQHGRVHHQRFHQS